MLDINKLKDKFDEILSSYDEEKIQQWFDFDDNRKLTQKEWENKLKQYAVYEKKPAHGNLENNVILAPYKSKEEAEEAKVKYGYGNDNYYVDLYNISKDV